MRALRTKEIKDKMTLLRILAVSSKVTVYGILLFLLWGCTSTTAAPPSSSLTCEQKFDRDLERMSYVQALGNYTQCLIDRGDTVRIREGVSL